MVVVHGASVCTACASDQHGKCTGSVAVGGSWECCSCNRCTTVMEAVRKQETRARLKAERKSKEGV